MDVSLCEVDFLMPFVQRRQVITGPHYRWNCFGRGNEPFVIVQWTQAGVGVFENQDGHFPVPAGHAFVTILPEPASYYYPPQDSEPWIVSWLNFYGDLACRLFQKFRAEFGPVVPLKPRNAAALHLRRLLARGPRATPYGRLRTSLEAYSFLLEWRQEAMHPSTKAEDRLAHVLRFVRAHFREPLGVKELAVHACMSREHFSRLFSRVVGDTPAAYLRRLRVREAEGLLLQTDLPLREIALRAGFYSERHLLRAFHRVHRRSPSQYRRQEQGCSDTKFLADARLSSNKPAERRAINPQTK